MKESRTRIAIIGAGAAGCFAAANLPYRAGREVVVFEKGAKPLQKVRVSGGGRCNVTHACFDVPELTGRYPRGKALLRKSLYEFGPQQTIDWFGQRGVRLKTEADGRMFPTTDDSQTIIDCLLQELQRNRAELRFHKSVIRIELLRPGFRIHFADKTHYDASQVLVATGGFPKKEQFDWLEALGHSILPPAPSLFTFNLPKHPITGLMGLSVEDAIVRISGTKLAERGPLLITHWGLSGPVVLRSSAWAARELQERAYQFDIRISWLPDETPELLKDRFQQLRRQNGKGLVWHKNPFGLPRRLWEYLLQRCGIAEPVRWGELPAAAQQKLLEALLQDAYQVNGKTTFKEEFVTCGGIRVSEVDPRRLESKLVPGLFFAGEVLDVDGITGGYNFQHAWCSGWLAARTMDAG